MLVSMALTPGYSVKEYLAIEALRQPWADEDHVDTLIDTMNLLAIGAMEDRPDDERMARKPLGGPILDLCRLAKQAFNNIKRRGKAGKIGVTGDEYKTLVKLVETSNAYWATKSGEKYARCNELLNGWEIKNAKEKNCT